MILRAAIALGCLVPLPALAVQLSLPENAVRAAAISSQAASTDIATGPWTDGQLTRAEVEGALTRTAWKVPSAARTTLQLLAPLREQLTNGGYEILFSCENEACGGFDFRYALDVLPEPDMHVDLGDFRYLSAQRDTETGPEYVTLLVSRSARAGFVQITQVGAGITPPTPTTTATKAIAPENSVPQSGLGAALLSAGHVVLEDLEFDTGSAQLGEGPFTSLVQLADWLQDNPDFRVTLVGHTDSEGSLEANVALSRKRANSVRQRLVDELGASGAQVAADGVGFLSPRDSNLTEEGRRQNRRVEVILTSTR